VREVVASDITAEMLEAAGRFLRERGATNVTVCEADSMNLPFGPGGFDLLTCRVAPHHFPDCAKFVSEMARVLRPGGTAAMIDNVVPDDAEAARYINRVEQLRDPSHHWAHPAGEWIALFEKAGFAVEHAELFRKPRDCDTWSGMMGVTEPLRSRLREMLLNAPGVAGEYFDARREAERVRFHLSEILVVARTPG
jgi:SAM-dependent methyltransferase